MMVSGEVVGVLCMLNGVKFLDDALLNKCEKIIIVELEKMRVLAQSVELNQPVRGLVPEVDFKGIRLLHFIRVLQLLQPRLLLLCANSYDLLNSSQTTSHIYRYVIRLDFHKFLAQ